ncbi:dihydrolipoyllysine-residue acetyltransferase component of pyruvate dehydrogenase complex [bacterium BMS3Abin04]|nr:dihydrolipoyllysine-residue acetyltransferase component of pyruvate dehydrogenase complex [bacterium BMS3Abin04]
MVKEFKLPELGENIESADIVNVMVSAGDKVETDQIILEIETDKANIEVPAEESGVVKEVFMKAGDKANVGQTIFTYESAGISSKAAEKTQSKNIPVKENVKKEVPEVLEKKKEEAEQIDKRLTSNKPEIVEFKLPELGENIESAQIVKVLVKPGDKVKKDQILFEIETDKANIEVPSDFDGEIKEVKVKDGDIVEVGKAVLVIETSGLKVVSEKSKGEKSLPVNSVNQTKVINAENKIEELEEKNVGSLPKINMPKVIAPAAPSVRRFAREIGIDINQVEGSGPGGRISIDDVKIFAKRLNETIKESGGVSGIGIKAESLPDFSKWGKVEKQPMSNVRRKTAEHLSYAWATIPHVTQFDKADITELERFRKQYSKKVETLGGKLTITAILLKVVAEALKKFPQFNSSIDLSNNEIIYKKYFNIGIAVDTERGLIVPVVKDVDKKSIFDLSVELSQISERARKKKTTVEEMHGGNFTISNLGGIGGTAFTPIVNSPEVAILGVSRGGFEPVYIDGEFKPRLTLPLSLSYDHRIIDGADAARFLRWVCAVFEQPMLLVLD